MMNVHKNIADFLPERNRVLLLTQHSSFKERQIILLEKNDKTVLINTSREEFNLQSIQSSRGYYWANFFQDVRQNKSLKIDKYSLEYKESTLFFQKKDNNYNIGTLKNKNKAQLCLYNDTNDSIIWKQDFYSTRILVGTSKIYCIPAFAIKANHLLFCLDKETGEKLWTFEVPLSIPLEELDVILPMKIKEIIGEYQESLFLALEGNTLVQLDAHTGKTLQKWVDLGGYLAGTNITIGVRPENMHLVAEENLMIGISETWYWEMDLLTHKLIAWDWGKDISTKDIECAWPYRILFEGDLIVFRSSVNRDSSLYGGRQVAIFNRKKRRVVFSVILEDDNSFVIKIVFHDKQLFVLDNKMNLFIHDVIL